MPGSGRSSSRPAVLALALVLLGSGQAVLAQTGRVIVYNGGTRDDYDNAANGFAWQEAGFLDPDGAPRRANAAGDIVDEGGAVVGRPVRVGTRTIGYVNAAATVTVVDLSVGTFAEAFAQVTDGGTIQVVKHGGFIDTDGDGRLSAADQLGGSLQLDNGHYYEGFGRGTGQNAGSPPYPLTGRANGQITFDLRCCWGGRDPDGDTGAATSVATSATTVPGVTTATGSQTVTQLGPEVLFTFTGAPAGTTPEQVAAAIDDGLPGGFTDVGNWVSSLAFADQLRLLRERFGVVTIGGRQVTLTWRIRYAFGIGAGGALEITPQNIHSPAGGVMRHDTLFGGDLEALFELGPLGDTDLVPEWEVLASDRLPGLPFDAPVGLDLLSGIYSLYPIDDTPLDRLGGTATLSLLPDAVLDTAILYLLTDASWLPLVTDMAGAGSVRATWEWRDLSAAHAPVFAVFGTRDVPEPSGVLILGLGGWLWFRRSRNRSRTGPAANHPSTPARWRAGLRDVESRRRSTQLGG